MSVAAEDCPRLLRLAALHLKDGALDDAETAALLATVANPQSGEAWLTLGIARVRKDEHALALPAYLRALALMPEHLAAWTDLGEIYVALLRNEEAAAAFRQAITLDPNAQHPSGRRARAIVGRILSAAKKKA